MRSLNTSITALLPILSLLIVGSLVLGATTLRGVRPRPARRPVSGAYSSIFIASPCSRLLKEREPQVGLRPCAAARWPSGASGRPPAAPGPRSTPRTRRAPAPSAVRRRPPPRRRPSRPRPQDEEAQDRAAARRRERRPGRWRHAGSVDTMADALARLAALVRDIPDFPTPGVVFKDITPLLADPDAFAVVHRRASPTHFAGPPIDRVLGIEARGFIVAAPVAYRFGAGFMPVRKAGQAARGRSSARSTRWSTAPTSSRSTATPWRRASGCSIVDDVLATGGTAAATGALVERLGGRGRRARLPHRAGVPRAAARSSRVATSSRWSTYEYVSGRTWRPSTGSCPGGADAAAGRGDRARCSRPSAARHPKAPTAADQRGPTPSAANAHAGQTAQLGRALHPAPAGGGQDRRRPRPRRHHRSPPPCCTTPSRTPASRSTRSSDDFGAEVAAIVDGVTKLDRIRFDSKEAAAGRHHAQDAGGDGQGPAGPHHQAGRPAPQHADARGHADVEAAAHRPGDARHLRPAGPPPRHAGDEAAARGPVLRRAAPEALRRDRPDGVDPRARARPLPRRRCSPRSRERLAELRINGRRHRPPEAPVVASTRRWSSRARSSTRSSTSSASGSSSTR